ncbi:MAG TPA: hypothetical protein VND93_07850 [Myxococcales bacterium]|nr:hypothetical protein [Myxococcales bacterium]
MAAINTLPASAGARNPIQQPDPGSQPAQLAPGEQEKIQNAMLQNQISNRDSVQKELDKPSDQFVAAETAKLQDQRAHDVTSYDGLIDTDTRFAQQSNPDFWNGVKDRDIGRKTQALAQDDQLIATVAQREPELRAQKQQNVNSYNQRIAQLQAGPVTITQDEAQIWRPYIQRQEQRAAAQATPVGGAAARPAPGATGYGYQDQFAAAARPAQGATGSSLLDQFAAVAARPAVPGLFG